MSDIQTYAGISWSASAEKAKRDASTPVYFVEGAGLIKIGFAVSPEARFYSMLTCCPIPLTLLAAIPGGPTLEHRLHAQFAADRAHGEWFRRSAALDAVIAAAPLQYGPEYRDRVASTRQKTPRPPAPRLPRQPRASRYDWSPERPY